MSSIEEKEEGTCGRVGESKQQVSEEKASPKPREQIHMKVPPALDAFVRRVMKSFACGAHDYAHVERVSRIAVYIARQEGGDEKLAFVGALVHDVLDSKLVLDAGEAQSIEEELIRLLKEEGGAKGEETDSFLSEKQIQDVLVIVKSVGFKNLLREDFDPNALSLEVPIN